ncbi:MAG: hypothetical protein OEQ29_18980 [Alphaproteobacteria bacterium]|nr:hypothetical protein [Alphaproteobacteria bacterium]
MNTAAACQASINQRTHQTLCRNRYIAALARMSRLNQIVQPGYALYE